MFYIGILGGAIALFYPQEPLAFGMCMIFDHKNFKEDMKTYVSKIKGFVKNKLKKDA